MRIKKRKDYVIIEKADDESFFIVQIYAVDGGWRSWIAKDRYFKDEKKTLTEFIETANTSYIDEYKSIREAFDGEEINLKRALKFKTEEEITNYIKNNDTNKDKYESYICEME